MTDDTPLLLVPGLNCTGLLYGPQIARFGAAGRAMIVADHTGADTIDGIAAAILRHAPERFSLVGLSMGGYVSMAILRRAPERVARLALLDTQAQADAEAAREARLQQIAIAEKGGFDRIPGLQLPRLLAPAHQGDETLVAIVREMAEATGPAAFVRQQTAIMNRIDSRPYLGAIACPTLVLVGGEDVITPVAVAREMAEAIPDAHLAIVPGAGHLSTLEAPEAVNAALADWLLT